MLMMTAPRPAYGSGRGSGRRERRRPPGDARARVLTNPKLGAHARGGCGRRRWRRVRASPNPKPQHRQRRWRRRGEPATAFTRLTQAQGHAGVGHDAPLVRLLGLLLHGGAAGHCAPGLLSGRAAQRGPQGTQHLSGKRRGRGARGFGVARSCRVGRLAERLVPENRLESPDRWGSGVGAMRARRGARRERVAPHVERRRYSAGLQPARCSHLHAADNCEGVPRMGLAGTAQRHARVASHLLIVPGCRCTCGFEGNSPTAAGRNNNAPLRGQACLPPP